MLIAITRPPTQSIADCQLTHIDRDPIDVPRAIAQHKAYRELIEELGIENPADIAGDWDLGARVGLTIDNGRPFTGLMDEFRMYTRALSHTEIQDIMQGP